MNSEHQLEKYFAKHQRDVDRFKQIWHMWGEKEEIFTREKMTYEWK